MIEINKIDMVNFIDKNTKKPILKLNDVKNTSIEQKCEVIYKHKFKDIMERKVKKYECSLDFSTDTIDKLIKVFGADLLYIPGTYDIQYKKRILVKRHKKKRINKKWNKKYGYMFKIVTANTKGWKLICDTDGEVILEKEI